MGSLVIFNVHRIVLQCYSGEDEIGGTHSTRGAIKMCLYEFVISNSEEKETSVI